MYENRVILYGHLSQTPELKKGKNEVNYLNFTVASNKQWIEDGKSKTRVDFIPCVCFGKNAETITTHFAKGSSIYLRGELKQSAWETKDGKQRSKLEVLVNSFEFPEKKPISENPKVIYPDNE